jgi:lipoate-protein ligase A
MSTAGALLEGVVRAPAPALIERATRWLEETAADGRVRAGWSLPTSAALVLGSAQRLGVLAWPGHAVVRRGTGGGAVICDPSYLMLDVALPAGDPRVADDLAESYRWLAERLLEALRATGAQGLWAVAPTEVRSLDEADRAAGRLACFAGLGPYEIVDAHGRKLVGLAQRRRRGAALFQAAGYLTGPPAGLPDLLPLEPASREDLRRRLSRVATFSEAAPSFVSPPPDVWSP